MKLTIIGCSGSFPGPQSAASCYLVSQEYQGRTWRIALDLGSGALGPLQKHIALEDLDAVCLSHLHPDHYMDLTGLHIAVKWRPGGWPAERIPVYGPAGTDERIAVAHGIDPQPGMHTEFDFRTWSPGRATQIGPFRITPVPVRHPIEEPYALRIEVEHSEPEGSEAAESAGGTRVLTYSGDTDTCSGLIEAARGADVFLCEAAYQDGRDDELQGIHLNGDRAGAAAAEAGAGRMLLTHIPAWTDAQVVREHAAKRYSGNIAVVADGVTYQI
ncbi:MBL fold metallo-hydrolase [Nesterenkonia alkaliphila]|uniref:MBL fold metallo-hydrolase n=1 Tax=Nesterenkonia alkaliphila TaxID=1463631 RepID=A0A7K1UH40_9MICC|nr:MBL fold metallo-hydrolase [Nesterenkonia alkaliphila]MVT25790.1 MBL fold metallo-hydrolase [Nesterenkonia alkaliphila]